MVEFTARRVGFSLVPTARAGEIAIDKLPVGTRLRVKAVKPRGDKFHAGTWAFFTLLAEALNRGPTAAPWRPEDVKDYLLVATGRSRPIRVGSLTGFIPSHTNFDAMDQQEYGRFVEDAMRHMRDHLSPWINQSDEWPEIAKFLRWAGIEDAA